MGCGVYKMKSWDCFDTLVARRFFHPHSIFDEIEHKHKIPNFKSLRISAELSSDGTYNDIYKNLPGIDPNIEIETELEHCFPIVENINKVSDGDLILSDMYLPTHVVEKILRKCGLQKDVKIIVTTNGKRKSWVWNELSNIELHTGDNLKSDVRSPEKHGITSALSTVHLFTTTEEYVSKYDYNLACWMRYIRLHSPYTDTQNLLWIDQANLNLPILALASLELPNKPIAFIYRDSIFWKPIYEKICNTTATRLDASRACFYNPTEEYKEYIKNTIKNHVIVDLQGSGKSILSFFNNNPPETYFIAGPVIDHKNLNSITKMKSNAIEKHNCSAEGSLISWTAAGPIRANVEHSNEILEAQHSCFNIGLASLDLFKINKNLDLLKFLLSEMRNNFTYQYIPWIEEHESIYNIVK